MCAIDIDLLVDNIGIFNPWEIPSELCFDRGQIITDYFHYRHYQIRPGIRNY
jgi:8-oxo-dGTP diphosphatase